MAFKDFPIARKMVLTTMLTSTVALVLAGIAFATYDLITFRSIASRELLSAAQMIGFNSRAAIEFNDPKTAERSLSALEIRPNVEAACIYTADGKIFATYMRHGVNETFPQTPGPDGAHFVGDSLHVFQSIYHNNEHIGTIYCDRSMQDMYNRLALYTGIAFIVLLISSLAAFGVSTVLQRSISRPILDLAAAARDVSQRRDYSIRARKHAADEVGVLTDGFNEMLAQIEARAAAVRASESRKSAILESALDCIITIDHEGKIIEFNPAAEATFGYSRAEVVGRLMHELIVPQTYREAHLRGLKIMNETGVGPILGKRLELSAIRKDGSEFPIELTVSVISTGGSPALFTGFLRDITERKRAEEQLKRAQVELEQRVLERTAELREAHAQLLETAHRAGMAEIATSILHNVGNVLTGINASASTISETVRASRVAMLPKVAEMVHEHSSELGTFLREDKKGKQLEPYVSMLSDHLQSERMAILKELEALHKNVEHIRNIVSMQQSYAGVSNVIEDVALPELIEDAIGINSAGLDRHNIQIRRKFGAVERVGIEKHRVLQILVNLLSNAKYAVSQSGNRDRWIEVRLNMKDPSTLQIQVVDNGIGITVEDMPRIFRYGFTTRKEGHGFGLHSSAMAAQAMGGSLTAESEGREKGATFTLILPVQQNHGTASMNEKSTQIQSASG